LAIILSQPISRMKIVSLIMRAYAMT
jgi:hypothetical protein